MVLPKIKDSLSMQDEKVGIDILYQALGEPIRWIARNAGADDGWVLKTVEESKVADFGFDAMDMTFKSMVSAGILDPAKVTRIALQNAVSVGMMILTTEALITDLPEKKEAGGGGMPGGGMGGMGGMDY
jgi:chaperonin GroEL